MTSAPAFVGAAHLLRRLLVSVAAVALLSHGGVELAPRLLAGGASVAPAAAGTPAAGRAAPVRASAASQPVEPTSTVRVAPAAVSASGSADVSTSPAPAPTAPHTRAGPRVVELHAAPVVVVAAGPSGRAPPGVAGT